MRVIAGEYRGRVVKAVPGMNTRPTLDKVKESVFNALGQFFDGGTVLDLYAGSGNLGIEALSRGASQCVFIDRDFKAYQTIKENIKNLKLDDKSEIYKASDSKAMKLLKEKNWKFDFVFLDPPYNKQRINDVIKALEDGQLLNNEALIVSECLKKDLLLEAYHTIHFVKEYVYGTTKITIYKKEV